MSSLALQEVALLLVAGVIGIGFYAPLFFVLWKFYQILTKINENIAKIRQVLDRSTER